MTAALKTPLSLFVADRPEDLIGQVVGQSPWFLIDQARIDRFADFGCDTRQFSLDFLNCLRRSAYSSHTNCTVALPTCTPSRFEYPAVSFCKSKPLKNLGALDKLFSR